MTLAWWRDKWLRALPQCAPKDSERYQRWHVARHAGGNRPREKRSWLESLPQRAPKDSEQYQQWRRAVEDGMGPAEARVCRCGCGRSFVAKSPNRKYESRRCARKHWRQQRKP